MTNTEMILSDANVKTVLMVDDTYDLTPRVEDIAPEQDQWTSFFDDLTVELVDQIRSFFPKYDALGAEDLICSNEFLAALWHNRKSLNPELTSPFFARYETESVTEMQRLESIQQDLISLGLNCQTTGRDFINHGSILSVDLIVIDLYLGSAQKEADIELSISGLADVVKRRRKNPPLVILMSSSPHLHSKKSEFRDKSGLFESAFRVIRKSEISELNNLQRLLGRMALHYKASLKLADFVVSWETGIENSKTNVTKLIKKLDLVDLAQIQQLLLNEEEEPTGSYLVDIFDKVLQYEVESESSIIDSAISLNELNLDDYPAPYVPNSSNLQALVHRSLFQNVKRLKIVESDDGRVFFGDVLRLIPPKTKHALLHDIGLKDVLLVVTPACDLQRPGKGAKRVMFMVGTLSPFTASEWKSWKDDEIRTPVIELPDGSMHWIKWKPRHIETFSNIQLKKMLSKKSPRLEIFARLRESHALELQQKLIANLGRVGLVAPLPATFPVSVEIYYPDLEGSLVSLAIESLTDAGGICYVGRTDDKDMQLVISESICEDIQTALSKLDIQSVHPTTRPTLEYLINSAEFTFIGKGINLPKPSSSEYKDIYTAINATNGDPPKKRVIGLVKFKQNDDLLKITKGNLLKHAGVIIIVKVLN